MSRPSNPNPFGNDSGDEDKYTPPVFRRRRPSGGTHYSQDGSDDLQDRRDHNDSITRHQAMRERIMQQRERERERRQKLREYNRENRLQHMERAREMRLKAAQQRLAARAQRAELRAQQLQKRYSNTASKLTISQGLEQAAGRTNSSRRFVSLEIAAKKFDVSLTLLHEWYASGSLANVELRKSSEAGSEPLLCETELETAIRRLQRSGERQDRWGRVRGLFQLPHVHSYEQLRIEPVWSQQLRTEVLVSQQRCACGCERRVVRLPMRIGSRTIAIQQVPRGTWDIEAEETAQKD